MALHDPAERIRDGVAGFSWRSGLETFDDITPPLQPDFSNHRLADGRRNSRDLPRERRQRDQIVANLARRQQCSEIAIPLERPGGDADDISGSAIECRVRHTCLASIQVRCRHQQS